MDPINLLVVERGADWKHFASTSHIVGHAMLVMAQQGDEPLWEFRQRIRRRLSRLESQGLKSVVLLRGEDSSESSRAAFMREVMGRGPADVRIYPAPAAATPAIDDAPVVAALAGFVARSSMLAPYRFAD
jgi:hypothetical protein